MRLALRELLANGGANRRRHHLSDVITQPGDLSDSARANVKELLVRHKVDGLEFRRHFAVHEGHIEFGLEVAYRADAADDRDRPALARELHRHFVVALHLYG